MENLSFRWGFHEKPIYIERGDCLKRGGGAWTVCRFKGAWQEKGGGGVFEEGLISQCLLWYHLVGPKLAIRLIFRN